MYKGVNFQKKIIVIITLLLALAKNSMTIVSNCQVPKDYFLYLKIFGKADYNYVSLNQDLQF